MYVRFTRIKEGKSHQTVLENRWEEGAAPTPFQPYPVGESYEESRKVAIIDANFGEVKKSFNWTAMPSSLCYFVILFTVFPTDVINMC